MPKYMLYQFSFDTQLLSVFLHFLEAGTAVYRSVVGRLEDDLCFAAALCANGGEVFTRSPAGVLLSVTASLAALGLVLEAFLFVQSLLACGEYELCAALLANKSFIYKLFFILHGSYYFFVHDFTSLCKMVLIFALIGLWTAELNYLIRFPVSYKK